MKPIALVPFVVALAAGGGWLFSQRQSIAEVERETEVLNRQVAVAQAAAVASDRASASPAPARKEKTVFDWKKSLSGQSMEYGGIGWRNFQNGVEAMDAAAISAALDEIAMMDMPEDQRRRWAAAFLPALVAKDPRSALVRFYKTPASREERSFPDSQLVAALGNWAKKDPSGACAWLDGEMRKSDLSNKSIAGFSQHQVSFEAALLEVLLPSDPGMAAKRLMAISENEAVSVIKHQSFGGRGADPATLAKLTRDTLPAQRSIEVLADEARNRARELDNVTAFLTNISASPAERAACVLGAATSHLNRVGEEKKLTAEDVDAMRIWAAANQPGPVEKITGRAIGDVVDSSPVITFDEAWALVMVCYEKQPSDELITGFLESEARCHASPEEITAALAKIADPVKRGQVRESIK